MSDLEKAVLIEQLLDEILSGETEYFKVKFKVKPTNNFKIYIDGDKGITIDKCIKINRALYKKIEEQELYPEGDFSLEVSSPGIDEPLANLRQYKKNIGRKVEVLFNDEAKKEGQLLEVSEMGITIEHTTGKGKKLVTEQLNFSFDIIKSTIVQIQF
ncbi:ribosome maturation factor [Arachidicoccus sp.]|jgi:ribosome maturation factor RimP|uniref:ribosome maturation factor n=1 Tax=Arachidicoccus sp. TaxID=1872624 RepID=UPI003D197279